MANNAIKYMLIGGLLGYALGGGCSGCMSENKASKVEPVNDLASKVERAMDKNNNYQTTVQM